MRLSLTAIPKRILLLLCLYLTLVSGRPAHPQGFAAPVITSAPRPDQILSGNLQGLGRTDLMIVSGGAAPGWAASSLFNDGHGNFTSESSDRYTWGPGGTPLDVHALLADFNGDGHPDRAFGVAGPVFPDVQVNYGAITSGFSNTSNQVIPISGSQVPIFAYLQAMPFKAGGLPQLLVEDSANGILYVLQNSTGASTTASTQADFSVVNSFSFPLSYGAGPLTVGDLNHDGNTDFIFNGQNGQSALVFLGHGDGTFQSPVRYAFDNGVSSLLLHDTDGDGTLDLVITDTTGNVEVFHGNGDGSFATAPLARWTNTLGAAGQMLTVADLNGDGIPDLLLGSTAGVSILLGTKTGTFTLQGTYDAGGGHATWAVADFNGDGLLDVAVDNPGGIAVLYGNASTAAISTTSSILPCVDPPMSNYPCVNPSGTGAGGNATVYPAITMYYGQQIDGTYSVVDTQSGVEVPSGTGVITLVYGTGNVCSVAPPGMCNPLPSAFPVGTAPLYLTYSGETTSATAGSAAMTYAPSTSPSTPLTVLPDTTQTNLASSVNPAVVGTSVTFAATVQGNIVPATGVVTFFDNGVAIGTSTLNASGVATYTTSTLATGTHPVTAGYAATQDFNASTSPVLNQVITPIPYGTMTILQSSDNPSFPGQSVTFTATVSSPVSPTGVPLFNTTGTVNFLDDGTLIGTGMLDASRDGHLHHFHAHGRHPSDHGGLSGRSGLHLYAQSQYLRRARSGGGRPDLQHHRHPQPGLGRGWRRRRAAGHGHQYRWPCLRYAELLEFAI